MPMGDGDNGVQQIDRRSCQGLVEQIRHQADGDTARLPAEQWPSQQVATNSNFAGPDRTGSLDPGEPGISCGRGPAHVGESGGYPHRPAIVAPRAGDGATGSRVPTCIVPVFAGRPVSPDASGIRGSRGQASPDVCTAPSAHQPPDTSNSRMCAIDEQPRPQPTQSSTHVSETESKRRFEYAVECRNATVI